MYVFLKEETMEEDRQDGEAFQATVVEVQGSGA